jgi:hypothetical protein
LSLTASKKEKRLNEEDLSNGRRIAELSNEIEQMPGFKLYYQDLFGLGISRHIFNRNYTDLSNIITFFTTDPRGAMLHTVENRYKRQAFGFDVICKIYNYVTAAISLVQHTRNLYRRLYGKNSLFPEYQERVETDFTNDPLTGFIQDLRNYCHHYKSPFIMFTTTDDSNGRLISKIGIPLSNLQEYGKWEAPAKKFLATVQEKVDVMEVVTAFHVKENAFQDWFRSRQLEIHADELKQLDDKKDELRALMGDSYIPPA